MAGEKSFRRLAASDLLESVTVTQPRSGGS
jgi:hypothetical protein